MRLLSIDPGKCMGWGFYVDGELQEAGVIEMNYDDFESFYRDLLGLFLRLNPNEVIIERPQIYRDKKQKGKDPNDLLLLAVQEGIIRAVIFELNGLIIISVEIVLPRTWKGQVPKEIHNKRILKKLTLTETTRLPKLSKTKAHNMIDAIGIGLWKLGR